MPSPDDLNDAAKLAYQAFLDMNDSKIAHFGCLQAHEAIYDAGGIPGAEELKEIEKLLENHDRNVIAFKTAMGAITDDEERQRLIELMS